MRVYISIFLLIASVAVLFLWGRLLWGDIQAFQLEKNSYESALTRLNQLRKTRDDLLASYNSIPAEDLTRIKNFLPTEINSGLLAVQLSNMTNQGGLLLKSLSIKPPEERANFAVISASVSGSYRNFSGFLSGLEKSLRLIDVSKISFSAGQEDFYDFSLEAKTYLQK